MPLTPGMASGSGSPGYSTGTRICNPCGGRPVWASEFGAHLASHEEMPREVLVYKDGQEFVYS